MKTTPATWLDAEWRKTMKLCLLICVIVSPDVAAQNAQKATRKLPEIVAHYKKLAQFSRDSVSSRAHLDTIAFPASTGSATSKVALTLPVVYLDDIPELMLIPSPPPNSSRQVREELDYCCVSSRAVAPGKLKLPKNWQSFILSRCWTVWPTRTIPEMTSHCFMREVQWANGSTPVTCRNWRVSSGGSTKILPF